MKFKSWILGFALLFAPCVSHAVTCNQFVAGTASASGLTQVIAATSGHTIFVCAFFVNSASTTAVTAQLEYGTGSSCGTGTTAFSILVPMQAAASTAPSGQNVEPPNNVTWGAPNSNAICINLSAAQSVNYQIHYVVI